MAGIELGRAQFRMALEIEPACLHEAERFRDTVGQFGISARLRRVLDEAEHPLVQAAQIGIAALGERAQQVERGGGLSIRFDLPARIGPPRAVGELDVIDDVAAIARQLLAVARLARRRARLGELPRDTAHFHHRRSGRIGQHHRHLQEDAEKIADVVGAVLGETLGAVPALQQKGLARRHPRRALSSDCAPRRQRPAAGTSPAVFRRRQAPAGPGNPAPARSASCASCRMSNARTSHSLTLRLGRKIPGGKAGFHTRSPPTQCQQRGRPYSAASRS